jgi:hypothetical protein
VARLARARVLRATSHAARLGELTAGERARWDEALEHYRRARARIEAEAADDWQLSAEALQRARVRREATEQEARDLLDRADQLIRGNTPAARAGVLPPGRAGDLFLTYFPGRRGWWGFAEWSAGRAVRALGPVDPHANPSALAQQLLAPFDSSIAAARRIVVFPYGALEAVDLHALPWRDRPLVDHVPVAYGQDLPPRTSPANAAAPGPPLIVANPTGDLENARLEGRAVAQVLGPLEPVLLVGGEATRARVLERLPRTAVFHYAGHGAASGLDGAQSLLALAGGGRLLLGDILALQHAPGLVVLSGCETSGGGEGGNASTLGLAQAFLSAGSDEVLAFTRRIRDDVARDLVVSFFRELSRGTTLDPAIALRAAQIEAQRRLPDSDWAALRILVP